MSDRELTARKRIERELHDGVQQDLIAIVVKLQLVRRLAGTDPGAAQALLDEIRAETREALDATRALALRIYPPLPDAAGLRAALRAAAPEAAVEVALERDCSEEALACAYFCCVDLLPSVTAIAVRDDGAGIVFEIRAAEPLPDLSAARDRVEALGGRLTTGKGRVSGGLPT